MRRILLISWLKYRTFHKLRRTPCHLIPSKLAAARHSADAFISSYKLLKKYINFVLGAIDRRITYFDIFIENNRWRAMCHKMYYIVVRITWALPQSKPKSGTYKTNKHRPTVRVAIYKYVHVYVTVGGLHVFEFSFFTLRNYIFAILTSRQSIGSSSPRVALGR